MTTDQIRTAYLDFFKSKDHAIIPPAPLVPQDDPTTLFNGSGMQQLVPYLKGEPHPMGKRLADSQPCFRAEDIEEVGDNRHTTFFEMLGNWSLGDYFKKDQLAWKWEFLTKILKLPKEKLYVSIFEGNKDAPKDEESIKIWKNLGLKDDKIFAYPAEKNWWSRAGTPQNMPPGEIGGTTSEVFYEFSQVKHNPKYGKKCHPNCDCGRFLEIANSVFMEYEKQKDGSINPLPSQNVDFGGGLERMVAATLDTPDIFKIDVFTSTIKKLEKISGKKYGEQQTYDQSFRVIADHFRSAEAFIKEGIFPSNKKQGYVVRRLIRRAIRWAKKIDIDKSFSAEIIQDSKIKKIVAEEEDKFRQSLRTGIPPFKRKIDKLKEKKIYKHEGFSSAIFDSFSTHGVPIEVALDVLKNEYPELPINEKKIKSETEKKIKKHSDKSRTASAGMFKGGLEDQSEITTKLHTATHLLHQSLRNVLGDHVRQKGSNITAERLRFDFSHPDALTDNQLKKVENLINQQIKKNLKVNKTIEDKDSALQSGVLAFFKTKYPDKVTVYSIGNFSKELCGGPHVSSTGEIGGVKIVKEENIAAGSRRIYAVLNGNQKLTQQN